MRTDQPSASMSDGPYAWRIDHKHTRCSVSLADQPLDAVLLRQLQKMGTKLEATERRALHWHLANLEFACAANLSVVSAAHWDQVAV